MTQKLLPLLACLFLLVGLVSPLSAQFGRVEFDYTYAYFNNGQPLPAEQSLVITGQAAPEVARVELRIHRAKTKPEKEPLFLGTWKRQPRTQDGLFRIPVSYMLTGSSSYDLRFVYFRAVSEADKQALDATLTAALTAYLEQAVTSKGNKLRLEKSPQAFLSDVNTLVYKGLRYYRSMSELGFPGFSDLVREGYASLNKVPDEQAEAALQGMVVLMRQEVSNILNTELVVRTDVREVIGYDTEETRRPLALNVGYGGVFTEWRGDENFSYATSPYVGISLPLANPALSGRFWGNASVSLGVFTQNFEGENNTTITGPIFGRPYYLGLGYNVFRFIRINAGMTALEARDGANNGNVSLEVGDVFLRPFVGISAEFDLWLGLRNKR